ncbi:MAG: tetratricopeptide repeat protein [Desulfobacteraceae bacterium]|nr:MAG: tetratricopeptide repeat protein [Desulfobacteraceae bacterium]
MEKIAENMTNQRTFDARLGRIMPLMLFFLLLLPLIPRPAAGGEWLPPAQKQTQIRQLFDQANDLFEQAGQAAGTDPEKARALFRQAALGYERLITQGGVENGRLYYNIGNSWFQAQDMGRAILNYRKAAQYIPNDANLRQNLEYARNKRQDSIAIPQETRVFQTIFFWHYDLSTPMKLMVFGILFAIVWMVAAAQRLLNRPVFGWPFILAVVLTAMMGGSLIAEAVILRQVTPGVILDPSIVARKGNSDNYAPSFTEPLHAGTEFDLVEQRGSWYNIRLPDGRTCWVPENSTGLVR